MAKKSSLKKLKEKFKIEKLPKDIVQSLPFRGITPNGIIETSPGVFTKQYKLDDINFQLASDREQLSIINKFNEFLNSFSSDVRWQFSIFCHKVDKTETIKNIKVEARNDGLNAYRKEFNTILLKQLIEGNNSMTQDKYLTVSIEDEKLEHANETLKRIDNQVSNGLYNITGRQVAPMKALQRIELLYNIYNQDYDYRFPLIEDAISKKDDVKNINSLTLADIEKQGLSIKDLIGPSGIDFGPKGYFILGDGKYARTMYLERIATDMSTDFLALITDVQSDMLLSTTSEIIEQQDALKLVKGRLADLKGNAAEKIKSNMESGYFTDDINPETDEAIKGAKELLSDISNRDQKLIFMTITLTIFADSKDELEEITSQIKNISNKKLCAFKTIQGQQEFGFNTCLPLCRNDLFVDRLHTGETASVFIPFKSKEVNQKNAIFYGLNETTKNMILYDRLSAPNFNGLIFGTSGSGKSFTAKCEMISVLLTKDNAQVFVIDPQGEYYPMVDAFGGSRITLETGGTCFLNPLDLDLADDTGNDPVAAKSDFVMSMLEFMSSGMINPAVHSMVDRAVRRIYKPYIEEMTHRTDGATIDTSKMPTLGALYKEIESYESDLADEVLTYLERYAKGSFNIFSRRTNINTNSKFVVFDIKNLTTGMIPLGLHICVNDILNRMKENFRRNVYTWFYIDEFHLLLKIPSSARNVANIWRMARKWLGVPTGITQATEDLLSSEDARAIYRNTSFGIFLYMKDEIDRQNLQVMFGVSDTQIKKISEPRPGHGLIYNGKFTLPFAFEFPRNTNLYRIMDTSKGNIQNTL